MADETEDEPMDPASMTYRELQRACKKFDLGATGTTEVLRARYQAYLDDPEGTIRRLNELKEQKKAEKRKGWVDWGSHAAREILLEDLEYGGWLYGKNEDAKNVFEIYLGRQEEFREIPFSQFEYQYKKSKSRTDKRRERSAKEEEWMKHDREMHPRQECNGRGEPVFDMDIAAKKRLERDVKNGIHKIMEPLELWELRLVYQKYNPDIFRQRIYQEVRRQKFNNYLEKKRTKKRREFQQQKEGEAVTITRN